MFPSLIQAALFLANIFKAMKAMASLAYVLWFPIELEGLSIFVGQGCRKRDWGL